MTMTRTAPWDKQSKWIIAAENATGERAQLTDKQLGYVSLVSDLIRAATLHGNQEASEQLDILSAIEQGFISPVTIHELTA